jgi:type IV secretion system protein VirB4
MLKLGDFHNRRAGGLAEFSVAGVKNPLLSDLLPWGFMLEPGLIVNKDGSFQTTIGFRGPDLDSSSSQQLMAARAQMNNALRRLGSSWCLHIEARRHGAPGYPQSSFSDLYSAILDEERRQAFEKRQVPAFESEYFLTFTYMPPDENIGRAEAAFIENQKRTSQDAAYVAEKQRFLDTVRALTAILEAVMPFAAPLTAEQTLTYLHDCVSDRHFPVAMPDIPFGLDVILGGTRLVGGFEPQLGREHLRVVGVNGFVGATIPGLLDGLNQLPFGYRWVSRWVPLDKQDANKVLGRLRQQWLSKRKGMATLIRETIINQESRLEDSDAVNKSDEVNTAMQVLGADLASFGYYTPVIVLTDTNLQRLDVKVRAVQQLLDQIGLVSTRETTNAVEAWLSSLPGHVYANCRRPMVNSQNLADLMPLSAIWAGPERNEHLRGPTLMVTHTSGSTPFRLSLHQGDVGHTMIVGPTGAGKSVLLNFAAMQFRRYPGAQVFFFDKGSSARCATHFVGGDFYALGANTGEAMAGTVFQPLADIVDETDRIWASEWIAGLIQREGVGVTPELKREIWDTLTTLASRPQKQRTLTLMRTLLQHEAAKAALEPFTERGPYGDLLDSDNTQLSDSDWQTFEMEALFGRPPAIAPTLDYLFHRLEKRFTSRPTMLVLDEAWLFLDDPMFAGKIREWLKVLRRRNVSVIFASQSLDDVGKSKIASALIENCPTRIFLPNDRALEPQTRKLYEDFGLSNRQIEIISQAVPKAQYYYQSRSGNRLFELGLSRLALTIVGSSSRSDLNLMDEIIAKVGMAGFADAFLQAKGLSVDELKECIVEN